MPSEDVKNVENVYITDVTADSRKAVKGSLYIAVKGVHSDGHDHIGDAVKRGASAVIAEHAVRDVGADIPVIVTGNTRAALSRIYAAWYGGEDTGKKNGTKLIAVTGTNGKTSVSYMVRHILECAGYRVGLIGTVENSLCGEEYEVTVPMTTPSSEDFYRILWDMIRRGANYIVFEASSHGIAQERLAGLPVLGCSLEAAIFTNLSPEHMDFHPTMEDYFGVKSRLFTEFSPKIKIINTADKYGARLFGMCGDGAVAVDVIGDGSFRGAAYPVNVMMRGASGLDYMYVSPITSFPVSLRVPGRYAVFNSMQAIACALSLGVDAEAVRGAVSSFYGVRGRMERVRCDTDKFPPPVFIDFAHTPAALEGLLRSVREMEPSGRIVVVFGCGGDRDRTKRPVMGRIAAELADLAIITSDNRRTERAADIINEILGGVINTAARADCVVIPERERAIVYAIMNASPSDVIVLAGKGHESYEDADGEKHPFDERAIVQGAVEMRRKCLG